MLVAQVDMQADTDVEPLIRALLQHFLKRRCGQDGDVVRQAGGGPGADARRRCACGSEPPHYSTIAVFVEQVLTPAKSFTYSDSDGVAWSFKQTLASRVP